MNNLQLAQTLRDLSVYLDYNFNEGEQSAMSQCIRQYPAAWLNPPALHSVEGREHGRITYDVTLHLTDAGAKLSPEARNRRAAEMEKDMLEIFTRLSETSNVIAVENLTIAPRTFALTSHGEISQTANARVITCF